jgi:hypothetical protein
VVDGELPPDITTRPLHVAFFACLGQCTVCLAALAERYNPDAGDALSPAHRSGATPGDPEGGRRSASPARGRRLGGRGSSGGGVYGRGSASRGTALLGDASDSDEEVEGAGGGSAWAVTGQRGGVGVGGVPGVSDDVRLLLTASNLSYIRTRLMGSLTQRFLLVLTGGSRR